MANFWGIFTNCNESAEAVKKSVLMRSRKKAKVVKYFCEKLL